MSTLLWMRLMSTGALLTVLVAILSIFVTGRAIKWLMRALIALIVFAVVLGLVMVWGGVERP